MEVLKSKVRTGIKPEDIQRNDIWAKLYHELFDNEFYKTLSNDAKILYCFMRDRVSLSKLNNKVNEHGIIYIYFSYQQIMDKLNCSKPKASKLLKELLAHNLIISEQQGQMKPNRIFVQEFDTRPYDVIKKHFDNLPKDFYVDTIRKPTLEQVEKFANHFRNSLYMPPKYYFETMVARNWKDQNGEEIRNWKGHYYSFNKRCQQNGYTKTSLGDEYLQQAPSFKSVKEKMSYQEYLDRYFPVDPNRV